MSISGDQKMMCEPELRLRLDRLQTRASDGRRRLSC